MQYSLAVQNWPETHQTSASKLGKNCIHRSNKEIQACNDEGGALGELGQEGVGVDGPGLQQDGQRQLW